MSATFPNRSRLLLGGILLLCLAAGCGTKARTPFAKVYHEPRLAEPGTYNLQFLLSGQGTLAEYLEAEKARRPELGSFEVAGLLRLFKRAYPELYLPVQPGVPLCNLETNFKHCRGIELLADFRIYTDDEVVLHHAVHYHIRLRLERDRPNFFRAAKAQRDRGEFALPRRYHAGALVSSIRKALPILQEIATDYRKYIKDEGQEIEIELTLEESPEKTAARKADQDRTDTAQLGGGVILSALPGLSFGANLTVSSLTSGARTFWGVLQEEKKFDLSRKALDLKDVQFSYTESAARNFSRGFTGYFESPPDVYIRAISIHLRPKAPNP